MKDAFSLSVVISFVCFEQNNKRCLSTYYLESHEYIKVEGEEGVVGITDFAQNALGDVVYVELPEVGESFDAGDSFGSVESVKAASDVYLPVNGEITATNDGLDENPGLCNEDAMGEGWFVKIKIEDTEALSELMDQESYDKYLADLEDE